MRAARVGALISVVGALALWGACSNEESTGTGGAGGSGIPEHTGSQCDSPADCYPGMDAGALQGAVQCMDRVPDGYCTHLCQGDDDCCAVEGECKTAIKQVCSPFESTGQNMCFLSCEPEDLVPADGGPAAVDAEEYCQREASPAFICRSSGGGSSNRKVCVPGDCGIGAACGLTQDCATDLECVTDFGGGYCTVPSCTANVDCPNGSWCVHHTDGKNYCMRSCTAEADCSFCRPYSLRAQCSGQVTFVETGTTGEVCVPPT